MTGKRKVCYSLKKRTKKLLSVWCRASSSTWTPRGTSAGAKVFCFFFSKKKAFLFSIALTTGTTHAAPFKVTTWNLNWFTTRATALPPDAPRRQAADIAALRAYADRLSADIIAFEEVDGITSAAALFPLSRYTLITIHQDVVQQVGLAIRRPIRVTQNPDLAALDVEPNAAQRRLRHGLDATVTFPGGATLRVLAVHLKAGCQTAPLPPDSPPCALLAAQIPLVAAWIAARAAERVPFALAGDFNRDMDQPEPMSEAFQAAAPLTRVTAGTSNPCWSGGAFIDHIFLGGTARIWLEPDSLRVMIFRTNDDAGRDRLSDHCPVSIRLDVK
jgi:endonuclease/exonuclease/phosphatase family metal-dependent hydrolase